MIIINSLFLIQLFGYFTNIASRLYLKTLLYILYIQPRDTKLPKTTEQPLSIKYEPLGKGRHWSMGLLIYIQSPVGISVTELAGWWPFCRNFQNYRRRLVCCHWVPILNYSLFQFACVRMLEFYLIEKALLLYLLSVMFFPYYLTWLYIWQIQLIQALSDSHLWFRFK